MTILRPEQNLGFSGGCNLGAAATTGDVIVFVNSDVVIAPDALRELSEQVSQPGVGLASGRVLLGAEPDRVNSVGNPIQFLGFSWSGSMGDLASAHTEPTTIAGVCGATFGVRRAVWHELGGFDPIFFAYCEDMDLSLRTWQRGYSVQFVPSAICWHWHDFGRHPLKMYLLERNRLICLLTIYEPRTLALIAPIALVVEAGVMVAAIRDGWAKQKWDGWVWIVRHSSELAARNRRIQSARVRSDAQLAPLLQAPIDPPPGFGMTVPPILNRLLAADWRRITRQLRQTASPRAERAPRAYRRVPMTTDSL
jgi:GT2 family glycosyltransferase